MGSQLSSKLMPTMKLPRKRTGVEFIPFVVDVYGGIGEQAKKWLGEIAKAAALRNMMDIVSRDTTPDTWQGQFRWEVVSQIAALAPTTAWWRRRR